MTSPSPPTNSLAAVSLVFAFLLPPLGLSLGLLALDEIGARGEGGGGLARGAVVVGSVLTVAALLLAVLAIAVWSLALLLSTGPIPWW